MKPSQKTPDMEASLTKMLGFDRRKTIRTNRCVPAPIGCGQPATAFRNVISWREFAISGLCQKCQDRVFRRGLTT